MEDIYLIPLRLKPFNLTIESIYLKDIYLLMDNLILLPLYLLYHLTGLKNFTILNRFPVDNSIFIP